MGKKEKAKKVVLDTNVLVSALLFKGELSKIADLWEKGRIIPVISKETFAEFKKVLSYPKFSLTDKEIKTIIEENILPFFEIVDTTINITGVCEDPDDDKFISCAISASAGLIVSGDRDLCKLSRYRSIKFINAKDFIKMMG